MLKVGTNLTVLDQGDGEWILSDDEGHKYHLPFPYTGDNPSKASELASIICDIGAENDEYARTVIPLIERILADDYMGTGLFEAIDRSLRLVEPAISTDPQALAEQKEGRIKQAELAKDDGPKCGSRSDTGLECTMPLAHHGLHKAETDEIDQETGRFFVAEEWHD